MEATWRISHASTISVPLMLSKMLWMSYKSLRATGILFTMTVYWREEESRLILCFEIPDSKNVSRKQWLFQATNEGSYLGSVGSN